MATIARNLILGFCEHSSIYQEYEAIRDGVFDAFAVDRTDKAALKLF